MDFFMFLAFLAAAASAAATGMMFPTGPWYKSLTKPDWTPPNWVFPTVWTTLYVLMAFAGARVAGQEGSGPAMAFWALQIALNTLWTPVFFGLRRIKAAVVIIGLLWLAVAGAMITHWQVDWLAGLAFLPYLVWVSVAAALNVSIGRLNPDAQPLDMSKLS